MESRSSRMSSVSRIRVRVLLCIVFLLALTVGLGQTAGAVESQVTRPGQTKKAFRQRQRMDRKSLFHDMAFRCVGPIVMSGRVVDIEPSPTDPYTFFVAYATGGLWKTENNGMRFTPIFEGQSAVAIGDIAIESDDPNVIWVGTGEANSARSHYAGTGLYRTTDGGLTWQCMGLQDSHHIGRVLIHPGDPNTVFVAAMGHLYTPNTQRGVFMTVDGGATWEKVLYINADTGAIDVTFDPSNPNVLYAAMWEKVRRAWNIDESGPNSGVYKSVDGGRTWTLLEGFPQGQYVGRIGLAVAPSDPNVVYALLDNQEPKPQEDQFGDAKISKRKLSTMTKEDILALPEEDLASFMRQSGFDEDYEAKDIRKQLDANEITVEDLVDYVVKLDRDALTPEVYGAEVYRSLDAGRTWTKMNLTDLDSMYGIAGYYFGQIRVSPDDEDLIYIMGLPLLKSEDAGRTYDWIGGPGVHVDHHAMWIDPAHPRHIINGNDGGLNLSYDGGQTWQKLNHVPVGQFYAVNVDMAEPYNIYGGLQDNGTYKGSSRSVPNESEPWEHISGGDGFYIQIAKDFTTYAGSQFGWYSRIDTNGRRTRVRPDQPRMDEPGLLYNWQTPILLSPHSDNVLYFGSNRLFRSLDRGENLQPISPVLTSPKVSGNVPYGTITTIAESKQTFGVLYVGTDDGRVHMTPDGGFTWKEIGQDLPQGHWVSRVETSYQTDGVVYLSLTAYREDDFSVYLYKSEDFGQHWISLESNLPAESVNVIREDPINPHVLYVGTDLGVFVSLDDGFSWEVLQNGIPISPAHDMVIHPRDRELVVGTHGRSIYVMDVELIQKLTPKVRDKHVHLFDLSWTRNYNRWDREPSAVVRGSEPDPLMIRFWSAKKRTSRISVKAQDDRVVYERDYPSRKGINVLQWDLTVDRDAELKGQLKQARKTHEEAVDKLNEAREDEEQTDDDEIAKLVKAEEEAAKKVKDIQRIIDEADKYGEQPEATRDRMVRKIYLPEGQYTVEIKQGKHADTQKLTVGGERKRPEKLDTDKKRAAETRRLLKEYEIVK